MARNNRKKSKAKSKRKGGGRNSDYAPRRRRDGKAAIKGMVAGGIILLIFAICVFVRIGGETPLNHLLQALSDDKPEATESKNSGKNKPKTTTPRATRSPVKVQRKQSPRIQLKQKTVSKPKGSKISAKPKIAKNAETAPAQEKLTDGQKTGLDNLIKSKSK